MTVLFLCVFTISSCIQEYISLKHAVVMKRYKHEGIMLLYVVNRLHLWTVGRKPLWIFNKQIYHRLSNYYITTFHMLQSYLSAQTLNSIFVGFIDWLNIHNRWHWLYKVLLKTKVVSKMYNCYQNTVLLPKNTELLQNTEIRKWTYLDWRHNLHSKIGKWAKARWVNILASSETNK